MKKVVLFLAIFFLMNGFLFSQTYVPPGEGTLAQAIAAAQDGDVLQLVPDGVYTESAAFVIGTIENMSITIEVEGDGSVKAIVQMLTPRTAEDEPVFFNLGDRSIDKFLVPIQTTKCTSVPGAILRNPDQQRSTGPFAGRPKNAHRKSKLTKLGCINQFVVLPAQVLVHNIIILNIENFARNLSFSKRDK